MNNYQLSMNIRDGSVYDLGTGKKSLNRGLQTLILMNICCENRCESHS